ncbi:hypothetical protein N0V84_009250 [Fusarium piperis]|uniref:HNH nuclease domain-containing protein n=1 Tax=Fusarium piperis TaxID=1435070 RepID=A0A9W8W6Q3_9HYPO|nr:hypothetical protein N0V84_009250 [Fusarium piperis]
MEQLTELFNDFARDYHDQPELVEFVRHMATLRPAFAQPSELVPIDEYQRRFEAIERVQDYQRLMYSDPSWQLSALQFSVLILLPLHDLETFRDRDSPEMNLWQLNGVFNFFLQTPKKSTKGNRVDHIDHTCDALRFDSGLCLATGTRDPYGCHIIPFTTCEDGYLKKVQSFRAAIATCFGLGQDPHSTIARAPLFEGLGSKDFNILSLTPTLHRFWSRGYCAFKWHDLVKVDKEESNVLLQFHWMPRSSHENGARLINLDDQKDPRSSRSILGGLIHQYGPDGNRCSAVDCLECKETHGSSIVINTGQPLRSGHLIAVRRPTKTIDSFREMISLRWAIARAAAMSGAARAPELLVATNEDNDDNDNGYDDDDDEHEDDNYSDYDYEEDDGRCIIFVLVETLDDLPCLGVPADLTEPPWGLWQCRQRAQEHKAKEGEEGELQTPVVRRIDIVKCQSHDRRENIRVDDRDGVVADEQPSKVRRAVGDDDSSPDTTDEPTHDEHGHVNAAGLQGAGQDGENCCSACGDAPPIPVRYRGLYDGPEEPST